ncbi:hypothetical protein ACO0SA_002174 [Hanseniaspora valbyensis]
MVLASVTKRSTCTGSKQKCQTSENTLHNLSVILATVIPVVCVIILVSCIIFYLWRRHKKEEVIGKEFDNNIEEDLEELYYKDEDLEEEQEVDQDEEVHDSAIVATGKDEDGSTIPGGSKSSDTTTSTAGVTRRHISSNNNNDDNTNELPKKKSRMFSFKSSKSISENNNKQVSYKEKGRLAIMRQRMKELENQSRVASNISHNNSNVSLPASGIHNANQSSDNLSFSQPPGLKRVHSNNSLSSSNSKKSNFVLTNESLNIPMLPSSPSTKPALSTKNSFVSVLGTKKNNNSNSDLTEKTDKKNERVDSILLNSNRLEDVSEQDMREYMRQYDKMMGISGVENMSGSFPGGRVPSGILQQGKFFSKNPYNKNNNTSSALKSYLNHPKNMSYSNLAKSSSSLLENNSKEIQNPLNENSQVSITTGQEAIIKEEDEDKAIEKEQEEQKEIETEADEKDEEVFGTPRESKNISTERFTKYSNKSIGTLKKQSSVNEVEEEEEVQKNVIGNEPTNLSTQDIEINQAESMSQNKSLKSAEALMVDANPFLSETEKRDSRLSINKTLSGVSDPLNKYLRNELNRSMILNLRTETNSGLLHQVEKFDPKEVTDAIKDIDEVGEKKEVMLTPEQEETVQRLKSVYKIYLDNDAATDYDEDKRLENEEKEDTFGDITNVSKSSEKIKKHTSSIYSEFPNSKGYVIPSKEQHSLPTYDINQYNNTSNGHQLSENALPNPELFADYYELDPQSEQYYYYDAPSEIHYYFDPISQQYYYYDQKEEQYFCNIDNHVYFYDSINHIPYYYDEEQGGYFYLGQPELDNTQFQQQQLIQPNSYRNTQLEQHIVEREEDHPEIHEHMKNLMNPSKLDGSTNYSLTNFNRSNNRKITPHKQFQQQMSQALAFDPLDNRETSYNKHTLPMANHQYRTDTLNSNHSAPYKISRESVVMTDPLQFSGAKTKFRPAGSIRNLNSYLTNNTNNNQFQ